MYAYTREEIHNQLRDMAHQMFSEYNFDGSPDRFFVAVMEGVKELSVEKIEHLSVSSDPHHAFILCAWLCYQHDLIAEDDRFANVFTFEKTFEELEQDCAFIDDLLYDFGDELLRHMNRFDQVHKFQENRLKAPKYKSRALTLKP